MDTNFVSYDNAEVIMERIGEKFEDLSLFDFRGSIAYASLPATPSSAVRGYAWNITDDFTTDARFIEGAGKDYNAGSDVAVANLSTYDAVTPAGSVIPTTEGWYELVNGRYVLSTDTTVDPLKTYYEYNELYKYNVLGGNVMKEVNKVADMVCKTDFDADSAYAIGDIVKNERVLYKFKAPHTAGDPWSLTEVDVIDVIEELPQELTTQQVNDLLALLG